VRRGEAIVHLDEPAPDRECRSQRSRGIVLVRRRHSEHGHHGVADVLLDGAALRLDLLTDGGEPLAHHLAELLHVESVGKLRRLRHVGEEHGHDLPFHGLIVRRHCADPDRGRLRAAVRAAVPA